MSWASSNETIAKIIHTKGGSISIVVGSFTRDYTTQCVNGVNRKTYWLWKIRFHAMNTKHIIADHSHHSTLKSATKDALLFLGVFVDLKKGSE